MCISGYQTCVLCINLDTPTQSDTLNPCIRNNKVIKESFVTIATNH